MIYLLVFLIVLQLADIASTIIALKNPNNYEANRLLAPLMIKFGVLPTLLIVKCAFITLLIFYGITLPTWFLITGISGYCYVVYNNIKIIRNSL